MNKKLIVTFGCSWTYGVGCKYNEGMSFKDFTAISQDNESADKYSFRKILSNRFDCDNINFSSGGSSNQKQFRLAKNFFISNQFKTAQSKYSKIIVLWGITSTYRNELFCLETNHYRNFLYTEPLDKNWPHTETFVKYSYDHSIAVDELQIEMIYWNMFFKSMDINIIWFDTFNHHDYQLQSPIVKQRKEHYNSIKGINWPVWEKFVINDLTGIDDNIVNEINELQLEYLRTEVRSSKLDNLLFADENPRDLMSQLAILHGLTNIDTLEHKSNWTNDCNRIEYLVDKKIVNPYSKHPTKQGHIEIADIMSPFVERLLQ